MFDNMKEKKWIFFRDMSPDFGGVQHFNIGGEEFSCTYYWFVSVEFWNEHGCIYDQHIAHELPTEIQEKFAESMESHFEFDGDFETALKLLTDNGFIYYGELE